MYVNQYYSGKIEAIYKVIVIGDPAVGKTSLLTRFTKNRFEESYLPTVGVNISKEPIDLDEVTVVNLMLWDIAGQPQFYMLHRPYFNGADGLILTFDLTRSITFSNLNNWWNFALKYGLSHVPRIMVGILKNERAEQERKIILPIAEHLSKKLSAPYYEVVLHTGKNAKLILHTIAELIYNDKNGLE